MSGLLVYHSDSPEATELWGEAIAALCRAGDVIAMTGELGAGKTQFTRGLAVGLGVDRAAVASPTFVLVREYEVGGSDQGAEGSRDQGDAEVERLVHIDAYRLGGGKELATVGWEGEGEELRAGAVVAVEWADRVLEAMGPDVLWVELAHAPGGRLLRLEPHGQWVDRIKCLQEPEDW